MRFLLILAPHILAVAVGDANTFAMDAYGAVVEASFVLLIVVVIVFLT